ncbi:DUF262 domain-containing protein [Campylobacter jejuni]|uniref:DUF262 domain-containing protein n=1 Tax=Campylobacter jejuni TaxID=197 RepID=UPI000F80B6C2|nr:DUF262 domain-containing protein [Campylobacter jejuni]EAL8366335.1 DUF262 domain-containing protein [Campylobacter jejuni]ECL7849978.1 DUF262 domain-containing protein [Campylobacter jejuni]ECO1920851.1 DUF262 domain-containing protein [Campylobacter jejuni]ECO3596277.1 DUF262 domain-containing protein [Campylobacter jejuni]ECQ6155790.1 DUF262 domain-containing protein [Campylobacter jejuni]
MGNSFLNTETLTLNDLLSKDRTYSVPKYQRNYSWDEDQWEDLWSDIEDLEKSNYPHFMGSIVLQETKDVKNIDIIDGQQRLSTLSIFIAAVIVYIDDLVKKDKDKINNEKRKEIFNKKYLGYESSTTLKIVPKLTLNKTNNNFFTTYIINQNIPDKPTLADADKSNLLLHKAFDFFQKKIKEKFQEEDGKKIAEYVEMIGEQLKFIVIIVQNELDAYVLFQTLNARGAELTAADLLKNYFLSLLKNDSEALEQANSIWEDINNKISTEKIPDFLRSVVNFQTDLVTKNRLFKEVRKNIKTSEEAFSFISKLHNLSSLYLALQNSNHNSWNEFSQKDAKYYINILELLRFKSSLPLLLIAKEKIINDQEFTKILKACAVLSIRYSISKTRTNKLESNYNKIACNIFYDKYKNANEIIKALKLIDIDDNDFKKSFSIYSKKATSGNDEKIVKFLLFNIERHLSGGICDEQIATIEHILPSSLNDEKVHKLGNYILLEAKYNQQLKNKNFKEKIDIYSKSNFKLAQYVAENFKTWDTKSIDQYQNFLAKQALALWKF